MKKLLIWDGDETLWRGTFTEGVIDLPVVRRMFCEELAKRGVLQAVASYNRPEDVAGVLFQHGLDQIFLHSQATLDRSIPKSAMVRAILDAYGLSRFTDVAFVDDDPLNLEEVHRGCPGIFSLHPRLLDQFAFDHLTKPTYTDEDRFRVARYRSEQARKTEAAAYGGDQQAFLRSCQIKMTVGRAEKWETDSLNGLLARAHRTAAVASWFTSFNDVSLYDDVFVARVVDRFGEYGLSGFVVVADEEIAALVVSCRTQGRGVGSALLGWVINNSFVKPGLGIVPARWTVTDYNMGVMSLYAWYGFDIKSYGKTVVAELLLKGPVTLPDWIEVVS